MTILRDNDVSRKGWCCKNEAQAMKQEIQRASFIIYVILLSQLIPYSCLEGKRFDWGLKVFQGNEKQVYLRNSIFRIYSLIVILWRINYLSGY